MESSALLHLYWLYLHVYKVFTRHLNMEYFESAVPAIFLSYTLTFFHNHGKGYHSYQQIILKLSAPWKKLKKSRGSWFFLSIISIHQLSPGIGKILKEKSNFTIWIYDHALAQEPLPRVMKYSILVHPPLFIIIIYTELILSDLWPGVEIIPKLCRLRVWVNKIKKKFLYHSPTDATYQCQGWQTPTHSNSYRSP